MESAARLVFFVVAVILAVGLVAQVFLAGLGVFAGSSNFTTHRDTGYVLGLLPIILIIAGLIGRVGRRLVVLSAVVWLLFVLQSVLVGVRSDYPGIAALHPVNGFLILLLTLVIVRGGWERWRTPTGSGSGAETET